MSPVPEEEREKPTQDTNNEIEDTEYPDVVINADSDDSDDDDPGDAGGDGYMGYQTLSQDVGDGYTGYQTLSQDVGGPESEEEDEDDNYDPEGGAVSPTHQQPEVPQGFLHNIRHEDFPNSPNLPSYMQVPEMPKPDRTEMLWNQPASADIRLDTGQADKIKSLMSEVQLPSSNIPDWAKGLSDEQWQAQIMNRFLNKKTSQKQEVDFQSIRQTENSTDKNTSENS